MGTKIYEITYSSKVTWIMALSHAQAISQLSPPSQSTHDVEPTAEEYFPEGQSTHDVAPTVFPYFPARHRHIPVHTLD